MKKSKKLTSVILAVVVALSVITIAPFSANAEEISGDYSYSMLDNSKIVINKYKGTEKDVSVPEKIDGYEVAEIGEYAFGFNSNVESVVLPKTVQTICSQAFIQCTNLKSISLPDTLRTIEGSAFYQCESLDNVLIPDSVETIEGGAFYVCDNLTNITLSKNLKVICEETFAHCTNLKSIVIPDSVTTIEDNVFYNCTNLENITFSSNINIIGHDALDDTLWFKNQPDGLLTIGKDVYKYKGEMPSDTKIVIDSSI